MSERCERMSERTSEWPSTLRVDFIQFWPTVRWWVVVKDGDTDGDIGDKNEEKDRSMDIHTYIHMDIHVLTYGRMDRPTMGR